MSICGRDCETCTCREVFSCKGCEAGEGHPFEGDCPIAVCSKERAVEHCDACENRQDCALLADCGKQSEQKLLERQEQQAALHRNAPLLGKWLWVLLWITFPSMLSSVMSNRSVDALFPAWEYPGYLLSVCCDAVSIIALWKMREACGRYKKAAILSMISLGTSMIMFAALKAVENSAQSSALILILSFSVLPVVISIMGTYQCFCGHAEVLKGVEKELSASWHSLWKWYLGFTLAVFGVLAVFLIILLTDPYAMMFGGGNAMLLLFAVAAIGMVVVAIIQLVKLYRTAQVFRHAAGKEETPSLPESTVNTGEEAPKQSEDQN